MTNKLTNDKRVVIFGASGHGKVVLDVARSSGLVPVAFVDDNLAAAGSEVHGVPVVGDRKTVRRFRDEGIALALVAIGDNGARLKVAAWLVGEGFRFPVAVHVRATVDASTLLGPGTVVMAGAVINADARLGEHVIVNTLASVDHDCVIGDGVHIGPGSNLCGAVRVGERTLLGVGSQVFPNCCIGNDVRIGGGATVSRDVPDGATLYGAPSVLKEEK